MTDSAQALAEENIRLVVYWVGCYKRHPVYQAIDSGELIQEGCLGLIRAAQLYDPNRNCKFSTYAAKWICRYIRRVALRHRARPDYLCDPALLDAIDFPAAIGAVPLSESDTTFAAVVESEMQGAIAASLEELEPRMRDIILSRFGIGRKPETLNMIAARHGICRQRVRQIEQDAIRKLKKSKLLTSLMAGY